MSTPTATTGGGSLKPYCPVVLTGRVVRLEPLNLGHAVDLGECGREPDIWRYMPALAPASVDDMKALIRAAQEEADREQRLPFAVIELGSGRAVGSTSYLDLAPQHCRLEIGWTWLGGSARRTAVNTECKYLLLQHAFETLGCGRVQLKTDSRNLRSQVAIERIGARKEGVLRRHIVMPDGHVRDTVMYSILAGEWPGAKARLESLLNR